MGLRKGKTPGKKSFYIAAVIFVLVALSVGHQKDKADFISDNWVRTDGIITDSELIEYTGGRMSSPDTYGIRLWYSYPALDGEYSGGPAEADRDTLHTRRAAEKALRRHFTPGSPVEVYFDPSDPSSSALGATHAPGRGWQIFLVLIAIGFIYLAQDRPR